MVGPDDLAACARTAQTMAARASDRLNAVGVNVLNSCGAQAWQTIFHFHLHVIPRYAGDPLQLPWHPAPGDRDEIAAAASLVMGQADEGRPIILLRGLPYALGEGAAADLVRPKDQDLFR